MKFTTLVATLVAAAIPAAFGLTINTPSSVVECEPTQLAWSGGSAPYFLSFLPAGQTTATPFESLPQQNDTTYTWVVNLQSGTSFTISLKDGTGAIAYSDIVTVQAGTSTSCTNGTAQPSGSSGASAPGSSSQAGSSATPASPASTAGGSSASSGASTTSSASSSSSTQKSGAGRLGVSTAFGVAGIMGLIGAALL